jgi:asparagine synthase (glutamine-hydrolysing)
VSGICGIVNLDGTPVEPGILQEMAEAAGHRGPDGIRYWRNGNVGLAHLALNITPESFHERQPLESDRGGLVLTADARVDNRDELMSSLRTKGCLKDGHPQDGALTDADLILAAYQCWGEACPVRIIGDFAFALWDARRRRLFACREPMGTRALYYRVEPRRVLFGTEIKQLLAVPGVPARIFDPAVGAFLAAGVGLPEWTFYQGITQLPPAHALTVDTTGFRTWRYWDIDPDFRIEYADEDEYAEHFVEVFKEAVRCRLRSTKPVGIFLSGGMDSGSVASTAGWLLQNGEAGSHPGFRAYCWAFEEHPRADERHISDRIVHHYDLPVTYIPADTAWPLKDYPAHGPDRDEPYVAIFRALNDRALTTARAEGMGWIFTGGLGDVTMGEDVFDYLSLLRTGHWRRLSDELLAHGRLWGVRRRNLVRSYMLAPLADFVWPPGLAKGLREPLLDRALRRTRPYPAWVREEFARRVDLTDIIRQGIPQAPMSGFARRKRYETVFSPANTQDVSSWERSNSLFGLGDTDPFSDRRVVSFALAVPQRVLARAGESKLLLRRSVLGIMPEEARRAAGKILPQPLLDTAVHRRAKDTVVDLITQPQAETRGYIDGGILADEMAAMWRGERRRPYYWFTLALEMWLREYWS